MKRLLLFLILSSAAFTTVGAAPLLFVNSAPLEAEVVIDGTIAGTTPLLVRGLDAGRHEVALVKPGHDRISLSLELAPDEAEIITVDLEANLFIAAFSADASVPGHPNVEQQSAQFELPSGTYRVKPRNGGMRLEPVYPGDGALFAARLVTITAGVAAIISTVEDTLISDGRSYFTSYLPSPGTIATWITALGAGGFWISLELDKRAYLERTQITPFEGSLTPAVAEAYFLEGDEALGVGNLPRALANYTHVISQGGDSPYIPSALYKAGLIYKSTGDDALAAALWSRLVQDYPDPDFYDRAVKSLSEVKEEQGEFSEALALLDLITFVDPIFTEQEIEEDNQRLRRLQEESR